MSRKNKEDDDKSNGLGLAAGLLVAGGAAAIGFMASQLWTKYQAEEMCSNSSGSQTSSPARNVRTPRARMESRKERGENNESVPDGQKCIVCFDNPREILLEPCNHVCLCENCAERITSKCPLCSQPITKKSEVFL